MDSIWCLYCLFHTAITCTVVGRLCALSGGAQLLDPSCILGLARLAVTLPPWPRHALTTLLQIDCTFMENVVSLWLTLNGSAWGSGGAWSLSTLAQLAVPADTPRIRLASDTVTALENVSLRCWVLSMQALAWIAALPLQTEGSTQTMGRVILECEHFVPAMVKFITMNVHTDGAVSSSELYLVSNNV
ncbi:Survivin-1 [Operophtera brumata]|uniref:Survivin-1 n=1 Tax=Operophtera brumata TaxID=104452 RepID=A0A0L7LQK5_OPEBR|nr:Survivin-1 [Operophtera brumata]